MKVPNNTDDAPPPILATAPVHNGDGIPSQDEPPSDSVDSTDADTKSQLEDAIRNNNTDKVKKLLDSEDGLLNILIEYELNESTDSVKIGTVNLTPLAFAAVLEKPSVIQLLLDHKADANAVIPSIGGTALHMAARRGPIESVKLLVSRSLNIQDEIGYTALSLAARYNRKDIVAYLLDTNADIDLRDKYGSTAFHTAAIFGKLDILKLLYERGAKKYVNDVNKFSNSPLHLTAINNRFEATKWLLSVGAAMEQQGNLGSALSSACAEGHVKIVNFLINRGANIHKPNNKSLTPILSACFYVRLDVLKKLRQRGASVYDVDEGQNTCYHRVIMTNSKPPNSAKQIFAVLFGAGANINQPNKSGYPPLFFACKQQKADHVEYLLDLGADVDRKGSRCGTTALMQACCDPNEDIVNMLLKRDPDTTVTNYHGLTALGLACVNNRLNHVKALIAKGAKTMYFDREGLTPIRIALRRANIEIALELLASEDYYPRNLVAKPRSGSQKDDNVEIENKLLEHFKFEPLEKLHVVMYWAVSNDALELVRRCIDHNQEVLQWSREGDTWLHIASDNGALRIVELLFDKVTKKPKQTAEWATAEAIMRQDNAGNSALTISIDRRHDELQNLFWTKIRPLRDTGVAFIKMYSAAADWILELLARYEKPGHEDILKEFLQGWYNEEAKNPELDNALHWAIKRRKVVVVWWLLSKGGYSSRCAIESAQKLVPGPYKPNEICGYIRDLLLHPPPLLDYIPNPNKDHIPSFEVGASTAEDAALNSPGNIVDILSDRKSIGIRYAQSSIHDIIYGAGPESVMKKAKEDLRQRDLNALRNALRQMVPKQGENGHKPSADDSSIPDWMKSLSSQQDKDDQEEATDGTSRDLLVRWIHLPVNELHLMRDLVSRLSYDSKRSEIDHMALMKHFNRSWSELAAGAERYYMKPQCVQQSKQTEHGDHSNQNLSGGDMLRGYNGCMALYMPYLTIGSYIHGARKPITPRPKALDESNSSRNSRRIKHTPLTLDQYYYPTIIDSSERDNDQVLSKFLQRRHGQPSPNGEKKILMVNQLWVWIIDEKTIITATTGDSDQYSRRSLDQENTGSLLEATLRNVLYNEAGSLFEGATSVYSIMELILGVATGLFVEKSVVIPNQTSKDPIEVFRESIRDVANQETSLFREFLDGLRREARAKQGEPPDQKLDYKPQAILNRYHVISSETELLDAIRDIRDELHMLRSLAEDQEDVWQQAFASQHMGHESQRFDFHTPTEIKKDLDAMLLEADKIESYINALLDLRQAEFGRLQAQDSAQLSNVILVLTVITIVFLPLSFLSSLFALDVSTFPHQGDNLRYPGWWLFPILFGVSTIVSVPAIALAWNVNAILAKFRARNNAEPAKLPVENSWNDIKHDDTALQHNMSKGWRKSLRRRLPNKENIDIP